MNEHTGDAPPWAVRYGAEFWRRRPGADPISTEGAALPKGMDLGDVVSRVSHAFRKQPNSAGLKANTSTYLAEFDGNVSKAAESMGVDRSHLYRRMRNLGIQPS